MEDGGSKIHDGVTIADPLLSILDPRSSIIDLSLPFSILNPQSSTINPITLSSGTKLSS